MTDAPRWRPIAEAPRDGTLLLGWDGKEMAIVQAAKWASSGWAVAHDAEDYAWSDYAPTHWMPLPPPPEGDGDA
jgi:hypothetical protein